MHNTHMSHSFEWDISKELQNISKHKISFRDAIYIFINLDVIHLEDELHSSEEEIFLSSWKDLKWRKFYEKENSRSKQDEKDNRTQDD